MGKQESTSAVIKLLIIDNSESKRKAIRHLVKKAPDIEIVEEVDLPSSMASVSKHLPDVITMGVESIESGHLEYACDIMTTYLKPVILVSNLSTQGASVAFQGLQSGGVDCILRSASLSEFEIEQIQSEILSKVRYWGSKGLAGKKEEAELELEDTPIVKKEKLSIEEYILSRKDVPIKSPVELVAISISTGGPCQIKNMLSQLKPLNCPILIAQHMTENTTQGLFDSLSNYKPDLNITIGTNGMSLTPETIIILPGGINSRVTNTKGQLKLWTETEPKTYVYPCADLLFTSMAQQLNSAIGIILTGIGKNGTEGAKQLATKNWPVLAQHPYSCIADGMPSSAINAGVVSHVMMLEQMSSYLNQHLAN